MRTNYLTMAAIAAATVAAATPADAQRSRSGRVADEIVREVENVADAVARIDDATRGVRYGGAERFAINRCAPRVEQYGAMRVDRIVRYGNRSLRVYGTAGVADTGFGNNGGYGTRGGYGNNGSYGGRYSYNARSFTCTVRDDGRVKLKTRRLR